MTADNGDYYRKRANSEANRALFADSIEAARAHTELAALYTQRAKIADSGGGGQSDDISEKVD